MSPIAAFTTLTWKLLPLKISELRLDLVLRCGQSFRWSKEESLRPDDEKFDCWIGALAGKVWLLAQTEDHLLYKAYPEGEDDQEILQDYFQLEVCMLMWQPPPCDC